MKRLLSTLLAVCLAATTLAGCTRQVVVVVDPGVQPSAPTEPVVTPPAEGAVKTGLSVITTVSSSKDASAEGDGLAQTDITLVAVTVDENGVIDDCVIDALQAKINFSADGKIVTDMSTVFVSKNELGDDYGMRKASSIGKEWNEQVAAVAEYAKGKTVEEIKAGADADLTSSCTMYSGGFIAGIEAAVNNAAHLGAQAGDKLALTSTANLSSSKDAAADAEGLAQVDATAAAITTKGDTITSCHIDAVQSKVNFDATGKISTDLSTTFATKHQLGDDYGMRKASPIGKEWNEQATAFCEYVTGKTIAEATGMAVAEGKPTEADLTVSCTMKVADFLRVIEKAGVTGGVKTGLSVITSFSSSKDAAADAEGLAQADIALTAVTVDDNGVITACVIDAIQTKVNFDATGKISTDLATVFSSKNELGDDYGMRKASSIGKEWNEQAAAVAAWAVGKTVDEIMNQASTDADLTSSCTMYNGGFLAGIDAAVANATHMGAQAGDYLHLESVVDIADSKDAAADAEGLAQSYATVAAVTSANGGTITSCYIDAVQAKVNFDATGKITSDLTAGAATKNELGDDYGMRKASPIGKEWDEQAAAFCEYVTGMTIDEAKDIEMAEKKPVDADLTASCTMKINNFVALFDKMSRQ